MTAPAVPWEGTQSARVLYRKARKRYAPKVRTPIVQWIEREYIVTADSGASTPGPYRFASVPWWREVAEFLADDECQDGVIAKSSQVGYTELLLAFIAWLMVEDPSSALLIQPTVEMAEAWSKERLAPVIRDVGPVKQAMRSVGQGMARSGDDQIRRKMFSGGWLAMMGANSASGLASRPVRRVIGDERDRWPVSAGTEGDPLELARRRTITYWNRKIVRGGTPTDEGGSPTWEEWEQSDQRTWHVPCPHCGEFQPLVWKDDAGAYHLVCDRDEANNLIPETAYYRCAVNACVIEEKSKAGMIAKGRWVAKYPDRRLRGYHIWSAYSPWMSWAEIIRDFEAARGAEAKLRTFVNTILGLPFAAAAEKIDPSKLMARAEEMPAPPPEVALLTAGVDVQGDRLEYMISGWGEQESWCMLEYGIVEGDPGQPETWAQLTAELSKPRGDLLVTAVGADTGYRPETVWKWADERLPFRVFCTKGIDGRGRPIIQKPGAVTHKRKRRPWMIGTDTAKDSIAARLRSKVPGPQSVRFSSELPAEFYEHLTAEKLTTVFVGSRPTRKWVLIAGRRNEGLDMAVGSLAALHALGVPTVARLGIIAANRAAKQQPAAQQVPESAETKQHPAPQRSPRRGWVNSWRG